MSSSFHSMEFNENRKIESFIEKLDKYKKPLLLIGLGCLILLIFCYRLLAKETSHAEADFFRAQTLFVQLEKGEKPSQEQQAFSIEFNQLDALMQRHPELKAKYQGPLTQELLIIGEVEKASQFAQEMFKRTSPDHLENYQLYSQASLNIEKDEFLDALKASEHLKQRLEELNSPPLTLYVFNLIRLAMLHQQLGHSQEELQIWKELEDQPRDAQAFLEIDQAFKMGKLSLQSYIEERKKNLSF